MKKENKVTSEMTVVNSIAFLVFMALAGIGMLMCLKWSVDGIKDIVETYQKVDELSSRVRWLEFNNREIAEKICPNDYATALNKLQSRGGLYFMDDIKVRISGCK